MYIGFYSSVARILSFVSKYGIIFLIQKFQFLITKRNEITIQYCTQTGLQANTASNTSQIVAFIRTSSCRLQFLNIPNNCSLNSQFIRSDYNLLSRFLIHCYSLFFIMQQKSFISGVYLLKKLTFNDFDYNILL